MYYENEMGRVNAELVRPYLGPEPRAPWNGFDREKLLMAWLARATQIRMYLHECTGRYCLKDRSTCRFFYPWPEQPQTQYDENTDRVALQRRHALDDRWVIPHNLELAMFSPAIINVLPFNPEHGADHARQYAGKYAAKPEKYYFLESELDGVKQFLKARTVGLCMAINRLLNFHVVRSTQPVLSTSTKFVPDAWRMMPRNDKHRWENPAYPDPQYYLTNTQKYFFRNRALRHMRLQQFTRYFHIAGSSPEQVALEDTVEDDGVGSAWLEDEVCHKHFDELAHSIPAASKRRFEHEACLAVPKGDNCVMRRADSRLAVSREPLIEPVGDSREAFYESQLLRGLPWYCVRYPTASASPLWHFRADPPPPEELGLAEALVPQFLKIAPSAPISFEERCSEIESTFEQCRCPCCAGEEASRCRACRHAIGFHRCHHSGLKHWRRGTLHMGAVDVQQTLYALCKKMVPLHVLHDKVVRYERDGVLNGEEAAYTMKVLEQQSKATRDIDAHADVITAGEAGSITTLRLSRDEMQRELERREHMLRLNPVCKGGAADSAVTDQWRIYEEARTRLTGGRPLHMCIQASAGTGKSFLLTTLYLWCELAGLRVRAGAPTGIAAANIEIEGTDITATTLHNLLALTPTLDTRFDIEEEDDPRLQKLVATDVLLIDEYSMLDVEIWTVMQRLLQSLEKFRTKPLHILIFGDFKQLPPATSKPPFIVLPSVRETFAFRMLRQNRRLKAGDSEERRAEFETFHGVLEDVSMGKVTARVREFLVAAYVRGAHQTAHTAELEGSVAVVTKRRYRDAWNRTMCRRIARVHGHSLRIRSRVQAAHAKRDWYKERQARVIRRQVRTQAPALLHLAGDWKDDVAERGVPHHRMRVMLNANLNVEQRLANGTQGRLLWWTPSNVMGGKPLLASDPELLVRFAKESSNGKRHIFPNIDFIDVEARVETANAGAGRHAIMQVPIQPAYALTVHKVQALSISYTVRGCIEGVFAQGQVYVLVSRVTDPQLFELVGVPPLDLLEEVANAWRSAGLDVDKCFEQTVRVTDEWRHTRAQPGKDPRTGIAARLTPKWKQQQYIPVKLRTLDTILNPQPRAAAVYQPLLAWIDRADEASQRGIACPPFETDKGEPIFPDDEDWWLTEVQRRKLPDTQGGNEDGPFLPDDGPSSEASTESDSCSEADSSGAAAPRPETVNYQAPDQDAEHAQTASPQDASCDPDAETLFCAALARSHACAASAPAIQRAHEHTGGTSVNPEPRLPGAATQQAEGASAPQGQVLDVSMPGSDASGAPPTLQVVGIDVSLVLARRVKQTDPRPRRIVFRGCHDSDEARRAMMLLEGEADGYISLQTNGDGACGLHAAFGALGDGVEFCCNGARLHAGQALRAFRDGPCVGLFLRQKVLTSLWGELTRPVILYQRGQGDAPSDAAALFWSKLPSHAQARAVAHVEAVEKALVRVRTLKDELGIIARRLCKYEMVAFLEAMFEHLKPRYRNVDGYDIDGKLDSMLDAHPSSDKLRATFFLPVTDAAQDVAATIRMLIETLHPECAAFHEVAEVLDAIARVGPTHSAEAPTAFTEESFDCYLEAFCTHGHAYYLSPEEVLATAEAVQANVVVTRARGDHYEVIGCHLGSPGEAAVLVLRGVDRGHFERLCSVRLLTAARQQMEQGAQRRWVAEERPLGGSTMTSTDAKLCPVSSFA